VTTEWAAAAAVIALASFVLGRGGFGNGLVAMAFLPFLMSPVTAIAVLTIYTVIFSTAIFVPLRRDLLPGPVMDMLAGVAGAAVGTPGPPVILYSATQGWSPRTIKANLQAFFVVNQIVILVGYWWVGVLDDHVWRLAASFALPAAAGTALGMLLFGYVDPRRFRRLVFAVLLVAGILLVVRG
jgi:uncharacterized membrane protein YfcA